MENTAEKYRHIKGWGIDNDPRNEPTYPIKNYTGDDHKRLNYDRPEQQPQNIEVLHSNERPGLTAVFGTSVPLSGLSGMLRRFAFRYSESSFGHWLPLIFADKINIWEGFLHDFRRGRVPDIFEEKGLKSELKYNKKNFIRRTALKTMVAVVIIAMVIGSKSKKERS